MTATQFTLSLSVLLFVAGLVLSFVANRPSLSSRKSDLKYISAILMGAAFVFYGALTALSIKRANRIAIVGMLTDLTQSHGRHAHSSFLVTPENGSPVSLRTDYAGGNLQDFQQVRVTYVQGFGTVTELQVVPDGWTLHEGDGSLSSIFIGALGLAVFYRSQP